MTCWSVGWEAGAASTAADGVAGLDRALRGLEGLMDGESGSVRITTGGTTVRHCMAEAIVSFRQLYPKVSLEFQTETSSCGCFDAFLASDLDLAWVTVGAPVRGIERRPVADLPWVVAVRADDPLAARLHIDAPDLTGIRLIRLPPNSTSGAHLDTAFAELGIRPGSDTSVADWDMALLLAELGLGHAVVPAVPGLPAPGDATSLRLILVPALPSLSVGWAVRRWDALSPLARSFADAVAASCAKTNSTA
ncbi:substrate-binding domain-containing protein [Streptomyces sp. NPDC127068]|uniref:substrate-binding domain-containing protein n=1 Tax=Streptomyces sp. NPDC127068 TaxID=3347127 RepID=UPI0036628394